jgi:hypothetical protein
VRTMATLGFLCFDRSAVVVSLNHITLVKVDCAFRTETTYGNSGHSNRG